MQEMFKSERSKVKFAQILVRPWSDLKACSYTPGASVERPLIKQNKRRKLFLAVKKALRVRGVVASWSVIPVLLNQNGGLKLLH